MMYECNLQNHRGDRRTAIVQVQPRPGDDEELTAGDAKCMAREYAPGGYVCDSAKPLRWAGPMRFEVVNVNPKTNDEMTQQIALTGAQVAAAIASGDPVAFIQELARADRPAGFMPIGSAVNPVRSAPALRVV